MLDIDHAIVPRIRSISLRSVGVFQELKVVLSPEKNFITGENGIGKSTLLWSAARARNPLWRPRYEQFVQLNSKDQISVEFGSAGPLPRTRFTPPAWTEASNPAAGNCALLRLEYWLSSTPPDYALLFDSDVLGCMDLRLRDEAFALIGKARCQILAVLPTGLMQEAQSVKGITGLMLRVVPRDGGSTVETEALGH
jgi:hypothetical protein